MFENKTAFQHCEQLLRNHDTDRFFTTLFIPAPIRPFIFALYAFDYEVSRTSEVVSDPMPGEIRLQWWRDVIEKNEPSGHPVAQALLETLQHFSLPKKPLLDLIDAHTFDLYHDIMPTLHELEVYCGETSSVLFQLACLIINGRDGNTHDAAGHAGIAWQLTMLLKNYPIHISRSHLFWPQDILKKHGLSHQTLMSSSKSRQEKHLLHHIKTLALGHLQKAQAEIKKLEPDYKPAFLMLSLVPAYLCQMDYKTNRCLRASIDLPQWRKQWILWRNS